MNHHQEPTFMRRTDGKAGARMKTDMVPSVQEKKL